LTVLFLCFGTVRFDRDYEMTCSALARFAEVTGRLATIKKGTERAKARAFVDKLSDLLILSMGKMKAPTICKIALALTRLGEWRIWSLGSASLYPSR